MEMYCVADTSTEVALLAAVGGRPKVIAGSVYLGYEFDRWPLHAYCTFNLVKRFID